MFTSLNTTLTIQLHIVATGYYNNTATHFFRIQDLPRYMYKICNAASTI